MHNSKEQLSEDESSQAEKSAVPQKKAKTVPKNRIVINISDCQYPVVKKVAKHFDWKLQTASEVMNWDVCWTDNAVQPQTLTKMQLHQKINHFPGMYNLSRKNLLGRGLMKMKKQFPEDYNFFPMTWMLPVEYHELKAYFDTTKKGKARTYIVKPQCLSQGKGIFLTRKLQDIDPTAHCVVQRYLHRPYLIEGLKFDFRVYVLIASVDPLTIYIYEEGLARFATEKYEAPSRDNMDKVCMHLTNYAINKDSPKFVFNESEKDMSVGHKRSLTSVYDLLRGQGVDVGQLQVKIKDCIVKTMISGLAHLKNSYKSCQPESYAANMCFELLGFDVMLNDRAQPIILEINHTPSFTTDTPLDQFIKFNCIRDTLSIMDISEKNKLEVIRGQKEACQQRVMTGKKVKLSVQERAEKQQEIIEKKLKYQMEHIGRFERIYPTADAADPYKKYIDFAEDLFQISMGAKKAVKKEEPVKMQSIAKSKVKRVVVSTTPDLSRKPITAKNYDSKHSVKLIEGQNKSEKVIWFESQKDVENARVKKEETKPQSVLKQQAQQFVMANSPDEQFRHLMDNYTLKQKVAVPQQKEVKRYEESFKADQSEKRFSKQKGSKFQNQKIAINLNTLLINGMEHQHSSIASNLKKYVLNKRNRAQ